MRACWFAGVAVIIGCSGASRDLDCHLLTAGRPEAVCRVISANLEWTWTGHAMFAPHFGPSFEGTAKAYCALGIIDADLVLLEIISDGSNPRLATGAQWLRLIRKAENGSGEEPVTSVFNRANPEYVLTRGCGGGPPP